VAGREAERRGSVAEKAAVPSPMLPEKKSAVSLGPADDRTDGLQPSEFVLKSVPAAHDEQPEAKPPKLKVLPEQDIQAVPME